ncbi:MAG TPA: transglycosylase domain-containing protein, partial [Actinomycetota bacterium]|nr:transglycosylase domain-containing protein [Actinomycetota bacterium]
MRSLRFLPHRTRAIAGALLLATVGGACSLGALPEEPQFLALRSSIYAADGTELATLYEENRLAVTYEQIPQVMRNAIVAAEDARFWNHAGIDTRALIRAFSRNVSEGETVQGGSTITQQLAKLIHAETNDGRTLKRKVFETRVAMKLEREYSKEEILTMYLNRAYFGALAYGVAAAAETYFGKNLADINVTEAAFLAGLLRNPPTPNVLRSTKDPEARLEIRRATRRRLYVLERMLADGYITAAEKAEAEATPIRLNRKRTKFQARSETFFVVPRVPEARHFVDYVINEVLSDSRYGKSPQERAEFLRRGGLQIHTTLNLKWQKIADQAVRSRIPKADDPEDLQASLVSIDTDTGGIRAMVGGTDYDVLQVNTASSPRSPGSTFKPFVLATAFEQGISPESRYASSNPVIKMPGGAPWKPENFDGRDHGYITLRSGMMGSVNGVYARLIMAVGPKKVADLAHRVGVRQKLVDCSPDVAEPSPDNPKCNAAPSIALGAKAVSPTEMANAYATFASGGIHRPAHAIRLVKDSSGKVIFEARKMIKSRRAVDPWVAYTMVDVLRDVACCGTATRAQIGRPMGAKTGTSMNKKDVWLLGFTPELATAVSVGYPCPDGGRQWRANRCRVSSVGGVEAWGGTIAGPI